MSKAVEIKLPVPPLSLKVSKRPLPPLPEDKKGLPVTCNRCGVTIIATEWVDDNDWVLCADCYNEVGVFYGEAVIEV